MSFDPKLPGYDPQTSGRPDGLAGWDPAESRGSSGGRISRGVSLAAKSWGVIRTDRSLLVLPIIQIVFQAIAFVAVLAPIGLYAYDHASRWAFLAGLAAVAFPLNFIATFCGVAFVFVLRAHLEGRRATVSEAIAFAGSRLDAITFWALLTSAVGVAIQALERVRGGALAARLAGWVLGTAWNIAALFVIPALATEGVGPIAAAKRSASVVKQKWGEGVVASTAVGVVSVFWAIPLFIVGAIGWEAFAGSPALGVLLMAVAVAGFILLSAIQAAVDGVFRFALFDYAENGIVHAPFTRGDLASGLQRKDRGRRRWFGF